MLELDLPSHVYSAMLCYKFADAFGWTPKQVEELDCHDVDVMLLIMDAVQEKQAREAKKGR